MKVGVPKEIHTGEHRVAATPETVKKLIKMGFEVIVQAGAGDGARLSDDAYTEAGAVVVPTAEQVWAEADILTKVRAPEATADGHEADLLRKGMLLISMLFPDQNKDLIERMSKSGASVLALDKIPRISRAQKMDVLSSMANIAGYRAIIEAAHAYGGFFGGQITAAGRTRPAQVLVIGAGVAGLAAIAAARALGAEVRAFDVRPAVKEQCESLGARFLEVELEQEESAETKGGYAKQMSKEFIAAEMALFRQQAEEVDIIVTTALIPGKRAPLLITKEMVEAMHPGAIVVDMAAEQGGNCGYAQADKVVEVNGVSVIGYTDLTSRLPRHASQFFGTNITHLLSDMGKAEGYKIDLEDKVIRDSLILHDGELIYPPPPEPEPEVKAVPATQAPVPVPTKEEDKKSNAGAFRVAMMVIAAIFLGVVGVFAPSDFVQHFTVFVLAIFIGYQVVWSVTPALHTPLMSVTNAISGIIVVGGLIQAASGEVNTASILGAAAVLVATINIAGGFFVTQRMLQMFRKEG